MGSISHLLEAFTAAESQQYWTALGTVCVHHSPNRFNALILWWSACSLCACVLYHTLQQCEWVGCGRRAPMTKQRGAATLWHQLGNEFVILLWWMNIPSFHFPNSSSLPSLFTCISLLFPLFHHFNISTSLHMSSIFSFSSQSLVTQHMIIFPVHFSLLLFLLAHLNHWFMLCLIFQIPTFDLKVIAE